MSTTIERAARAAGWAVLALGAWTAVLLAMPFVGPAGRDVAVVGDTARALRVIAAAGGEVVQVRRGATLARSDRPGFVAALYRNGAWLVVEGRIGAGCTAPAPGGAQLKAGA